MPLLTTDISVLCPRDNRKVNVKIDCQPLPVYCPYFKHFAYQGTKVYVVCSFEEKTGEKELPEVIDQELEDMEEESLETDEPR